MIFETPRLVARRFDPRDLAAFTAMRADADVARFQSWESFDESAGRDFLNDMSARNPGDPGWFQFALVWRGPGDFIGDCGLRICESSRERRTPGKGHLDDLDRCGRRLDPLASAVCGSEC